MTTTTTTTTTTTHFLSRPIRDLRLRTSLNDTTDERRCGQHLDARLGAAVWGGGFPLSQVQSCEKGSEVSRNLDTFSSRYVKKRRVVRFFIHLNLQN